MNYTKTNWKDGVYQYPDRFKITDNGNGTVNITREVGTITQQQTDVVADLMNNIESGISYSDDGSMYKNITGTANNMLCELNESVLQGQIVRFIAIGDTGGNGVTLNGIPLYRVNSTTPPNIKKGEKVVLCYNQSNNCWLYQHSAEGNVTSSQVLTGYRFSNNDGLNLVGTMPVIPTTNVKLTNIGQTYTLAQGYYNSGSSVIAPTYNDIANGTTVTDPKQVLSGYAGINTNGLVKGTMMLDDFYEIGVGMANSDGNVVITGVTKDILLAILMYNGEGNYSTSYGYDEKQIVIFDPYKYLLNDLENMFDRTIPQDTYTSFRFMGNQKSGSSPSTKWGFTFLRTGISSTLVDGTLTLSMVDSSFAGKACQYIIFYR